MPSSYPSTIDTWTTLTDNVSTILAETPNFLASAILALENYVGVTNSNVATSHTYLLAHLPGQAQNWNVGAYTVTASQFISTITTGTAPFTISSTTVVPNLNATYLSGNAAPNSSIVGISDTQNLSNKTLSSSNISSLVSPLSLANGGTASTTQQAAMNSLAGAVTSGYYLRGNGTNVSMTAIQFSDLPTLTTGSSILYGNGSGGFSNVTVSTGLSFSGGTLQMGNGLGTWTSISVTTIYQASTDGLVTVYAQISNNAGGINIYTDSSASPSTLRVSDGTPNGGSGGQAGGSCFVRKNDYYEIVQSGNIEDSFAYFIPLGS